MKAISLLFLLVGCASNEHLPHGKLSRQLEQCYHESDSIFLKPPVEGKMVIQLTANSEGVVRSAKILESDFSKDRNLEACVVGQLKTLRYPKSPEGKDVDYIQPINFMARR